MIFSRAVRVIIRKLSSTKLNSISTNSVSKLSSPKDRIRMRPILTYKPTPKEVAAFQQKIKEHEPQGQRPDDFLPSSMPDVLSPRKSAVKKKWRATPSDENMRPDGWLGISDPSKKKRSWKMKRVITVNLEEDED
jgi:hypothetical protein